MAMCQIRFRSEVLGKQTSLHVLLPRVGDPPFPTLYLLHGLGDDDSAWTRHTRLEFYVRELPWIVVMPDGDRGFFTDNACGPAYARYLGEELPAFIEKQFRAGGTRSARAIGGNSMGGYGALRVALGYPQVFASAHSHSGALLRGELDFRPEAVQTHPLLKERPAEYIAEMRRVFGDRPRGTEHDLHLLAARARGRGNLPRLLIDCGTEDYLLEDNRVFHAAFENAGIAHRYEESAGAHTWDYWEMRLPRALAFHAETLAHAASPP